MTRGPVGAVIPDSGRYAVQGAQLRTGIEMWASRFGRELIALDDQSSPERSAVLHWDLLERGCEWVLGPYGGDSTREVAKSKPSVLWNHGAAADDVQTMPRVVSLPSPASRYLIALGTAVAAACPAARIALIASKSPFGRFAIARITRQAAALGLSIAGSFSFADDAAAVAAVRADAVLACGPLARELDFFREFRGLAPSTMLGGVAAGLSSFDSLLGRDPEGFLAPVQWHPDVPGVVELGPRSEDVLHEAPVPLDYVAAQAYAAAIVADHCLELDPEDPYRVAAKLRTTTFFGGFELDARTGIQVGHRLSVIRWRRGRRELFLVDCA